MIKSIAAMMMLITATASTAGTLSAFDAKAPLSEFDTARKMEDVERCLIDIGNNGLPYIYQQADRPDDITIMWQPNLDASRHRLDLHRIPEGTRIRSWMPAKQVDDCAPK